MVEHNQIRLERRHHRRDLIHLAVADQRRRLGRIQRLIHRLQNFRTRAMGQFLQLIERFTRMRTRTTGLMLEANQNCPFWRAVL
jgi:hypothetical protein